MCNNVTKGFARTMLDLITPHLAGLDQTSEKFD